MSIIEHAVSKFELPKELFSLERWTKIENINQLESKIFFKSRILPRACCVLKLELHAHLLDVSELELPLLQVIS